MPTTFAAAPLPTNEDARRQAVLRSGLHVMDGSAELQEVCDRVKAQFNSNWAAIVAIIDGWQYVIASTEAHLGSHRRSACLSSFAILEPEKVFYILDAAKDERFSGSTYVENGLIAFYAGAPIVDDQGYAVGVLCITDRVGRKEFGSVDQAALLKIAAQIIT